MYGYIYCNMFPIILLDCMLPFPIDDHSQCVSSDELRILIHEVLKEPDGSVAYADNITDGANDWDFASSILVAMTVVTTIGITFF